MKIFLRTLICFIIITASAFNVSAADVNPASARKAAGTFLKQKDKSADFAITSIKPFNDNGLVNLYFVTLSPNGFIILSADDNAQPVLGYSFESSLPDTGIIGGFSEWMLGFSKYVDVCRIHPQFQMQANADLWRSLINGTYIVDNPSAIVGPLLTSIWDQSFPYNSECPKDPAGSGGHVYAGCVATAMSQVMYYYRYPKTGTGSYGYYHPQYGYLFADFGATEYKWNEMPDYALGPYYQLALLQSHLGISVDMDYSPSGSGAYSQDAAQSLKSYFGYSDELTLILKDSYSETAWAEIVKQNIDAGHPLYYHGFGSGGHAFNLDGYDGDYYHFNWGWSGTANGYYSLNNLNPSGMNFSYGQGAIVNFYPGEGYPYYCNSVDTLTSLTGSIEDGSGPVEEYNSNSNCGWLISINDTLSNLKLVFDRFDLDENSDTLYIYDGINESYPLIGAFTGSVEPPILNISSAEIFIRFKSDGQGEGNGFLMDYFADPYDFCSGNQLYTDSINTIQDGSNNWNYRNNSNCMFRIKPSGAKSISFNFSYLDTYDQNDYLSILDTKTMTELVRVYGTDNDRAYTFNVSDILVRFITDGENNAGGWEFTYHGSALVNNKSEIISGDIKLFPQPAANEVNITAVSGKKINSVSVLSLDGKLLGTFTSNNNNTDKLQIDISAFSAGVYMLVIDVDGVRIMKKLVVTK